MRIDRALRQLAAEKGLSQAALCRRTGISSGHMSMIFSGKVRAPSFITLYGIAHDGLGVSLEDVAKLAVWLEHGEGL